MFVTTTAASNGLKHYLCLYLYEYFGYELNTRMCIIVYSIISNEKSGIFDGSFRHSNMISKDMNTKMNGPVSSFSNNKQVSEPMNEILNKHTHK